MTEENKDWGCPDWRDADGYPESGESLNDWQWGWEFVRRIPEYRKFFDTSISAPDLIPDNVERSILQRSKDSWLFTNFSLGSAINPRRRLKQNPFFLVGGTSVSVPSKEWMLEKWQILERERPEELKDYFTWLINYMSYSGITAPLEGEKDLRPKHLQKIVTILFDLNKPIKPQILTARGTLEIEAEKIGAKIPRAQFYGKIRDTWPRHLRVIDAEDQGASDKDIYDQFLRESEVNLEQYDRLNVEQEYVLVHDWKKAARATMEKVAYLL